MRKYAWIYILIAVVAVVWGVRFFLNQPTETETAYPVSYEDTVKASGVLVRNETVYKADTGGSLQSEVSDEARVAKGKKIATVYTDGIDSNLKVELDNVNEKIEKLESATAQSEVFGSDLVTIETRVKASIDELVEASVSHDLSELPVIRQELEKLISTQQEVSGAESPRQSALDDLYAQREQIEGSINSAKRDIYSSAAGVYIVGVDGCEAILTPEAVMTMGVDEFSGLSIPKRYTVKEHYNAGEDACKTVDNGIWYLAATMTADTAAAIEEAEANQAKRGSSLHIRIPELDAKEVPVAVETVSEESNGNVLVVFSSRNYIKGIYGERSVEVEIIKGNYEGLKVPASALRVVEEETGVFVNTDGVARFRKVDVLYRDDTMAIVDKSEESGYLKIYDPVIVEGKDIEQGKLIN